MISEYIERIVNSELESLLWSSVMCYEEDCPNYGEAFDLHYSPAEASTELREKLTDELLALDAQLEEEPTGKLATACQEYFDSLSDWRNFPEKFGHDLALTRNQHGVGFWDRGLGEAGVVLTDWAESQGTAELFVVSATEFSAE